MYTVLHLTVQSFLSTYIGKICTVSVLKKKLYYNEVLCEVLC